MRFDVCRSSLNAFPCQDGEVCVKEVMLRWHPWQINFNPARRRLQVKKDLQLKLAASKGKTGKEDEEEEAGSDAGSESSLDEEGKILEEMDDVRSKAAARLKKERKKRRESKKKARIRSAQLALSKPLLRPAYPCII